MPKLGVTRPASNFKLVRPAKPIAATVFLTTPNVSLAAPLLWGTQPQVTGTLVEGGGRNPVAFASEPPALITEAFPNGQIFGTRFGNVPGQWVFAVVSWRQDAGQPGKLLYPSTTNIADDAANFWTPIAVTPPNAGIIRTAVWMAPAARTFFQLFTSPTAWQAATCITLFPVVAACPWYSVSVQASSSANQAQSVSVSQPTGSPGVFTIGAMAWDGYNATVTTTTPGWSPVTFFGNSAGSTNFVNGTGDLIQQVWTSINPTTMSASSSQTMDWSAITVTVHGVADAIPFPYKTPVANWPAVVTEIAADPALNVNPLILNGTTDWTATGGTLAAANWPAWNPNPYYQTLITQSLSLSPSGAAGTVSVASGTQPVNPVLQYNAVAYAYSVAGLPANTSASAFISWYTAAAAPVSTTAGTAVPLNAGAWTPLTFPNPVYPPGTAASGAVGVQLTTNGSVPSTAVIYVGYCAFGGSDGYENLTPDQITWNDVSALNWAYGSMQVSRGLQYEQQSLEAGTASLTLTNSDYAFMFGNTEAARWPNIGDTDVPIRVRLVNPASVTPYTVLFSGYTDDIDFGIDKESYQAWATFTCSDAWSRMTQQMVSASVQEVLEDNAVDLWPCSGSGANVTPGALTPVTTLTSQYGAASGAGSLSATYSASFGGSAIQLPGSQGGSNWQSAISGTVPAVNYGVALGYFPALASGPSLPAPSGGVTVEFWMNPVSDYTTQPAAILTLAACWSGTGIMWEITLNNTGTNYGTASVTVYDRITGAATTTSLGTVQYLNSVVGGPGTTYFFAVTFTQSSLTVTVNPTQVTFSSTTVTCNLSNVVTGLTFGGNAGPVYGANTDGNLGFMSNLAIANVAVFGYIVPASRITQHYLTAFSAWPSEIDTWRLARIAGYSGFVPVLGMKGTELGGLFQPFFDLIENTTPDVDPVTAITDTSGQVVSSYFTNVASSTLAAMFVNGPGALIYRRRLEWYDRLLGQYAIGENESIALNNNTLGRSPSLSGWFTFNNATLVSASLPSAGPQFVFCGLMTGNGSTSNPFIEDGFFTGTPVTAGEYYTASCWVYSPQGWNAGTYIGWFWKTSTGGGNGVVQSGNHRPLAAGSVTYLTCGPFRAPQNTAFAGVFVAVTGTPPSSVQFYITGVALSNQQPATAGGAGAVAAEAPAAVDAKLSSDRAQLFNQAILNQSGTNTLTTYSGTSLNFTPSSGVVVIIQNNASFATRGSIPYTATIYLDNTQQALPYVLSEGSIEDVGNWIVQTLGQPLFRPLTVTLTPVATPSALATGLMIEVGDTVTFRRRMAGVPEIQIVTYVSKLSHDINMEQGQWEVQMELSPFPQGFALACDDVVHGVLTGGNSFPW